MEQGASFWSAKAAQSFDQCIIIYCATPLPPKKLINYIFPPIFWGDPGPRQRVHMTSTTRVGSNEKSRIGTSEQRPQLGFLNQKSFLIDVMPQIELKKKKE